MMQENTQTLAQFIEQHAPGHRIGTKALRELVEGIKRTGKGGSISFTVKLVPDPKRNHALLVSDSVTAKVPQLDPPQRLTWLTPSGEIIDHDPNQLPLPIDDPAVVRTSTTTIDSDGGIFTQDGPDDSLPAHSEEQAARVLQFAEAAFSQTPPPGAVDEDDYSLRHHGGDPASPPGDDEPGVEDGVQGTTIDGITYLPGDDLPMMGEGEKLDPYAGSVKAEDFDTTTGAALADAAAAAAPKDNVTEIGTKTRAPRKSRAKATASAT